MADGGRRTATTSPAARSLALVWQIGHEEAHEDASALLAI
jgi:hypothetical protein